MGGRCCLNRNKKNVLLLKAVNDTPIVAVALNVHGLIAAKEKQTYFFIHFIHTLCVS